MYLNITLPELETEWKNKLVTTELLGKAQVPQMAYENPDGTPYKLDKDYFDKKRNVKNPSPGPLEHIEQDQQTIKVWPVVYFEKMNQIQ